MERAEARERASLTVGTVVPLRRPSAVRVEEADAVLAEFSARRSDGSMLVEGVLECRVTYVGRDGVVRPRLQRVAFRQGLPWQGADEPQGGFPVVRVRGVDYRLAYRPGRDFGDAAELLVHLDVEETARSDRSPVPATPVAADGPAPASTLLVVEELVGEGSAEVLEDMEVLLDLAAFKVIDVQCRVADVTANALAGCVLVEGRVFQQIYYVAEDGLIHYQHAEVSFQRTVEAPCEPGLQARAQVTVRSVEHELTQDGRLLSGKLFLRLQVKATRPTQLEVVTALPDARGVEVTRDTVRVDQVVGAASTRIVERRASRLPVPAAEVVKMVAALEGVRPQVLHGQVLVEGVARQQVFYTAGGVSYHFEEDVPWSCVLDVRGAEPGMQAQAEARVEEATARAGKDARELEQELLVAVAVRVSQPRTLAVVTAASGEGVAVESRRLRVERLVGQTVSQMMLQKKVVLVSRALGIARVAGSLQDLHCEVIPDQVIVQGRLHQQVFFIDRQKIERHQTEDLPFTHLVDLPGALPGMTAEIQPRIKHLSHALGTEGNAFSEKAVVELAVRVVEAVDLSVVTALQAPGAQQPAPAVRDAGAPDGATARCAGFLPFRWPYATQVRDVRPSLCLSPDDDPAAAEGRSGSGGGRPRPRERPSPAFARVRVRASYVGPDRVVYHAGAEAPVPGDRAAVAVRDFRWTPVEVEPGRYEGIRWEAVLQCSASPSI